MTSASLIRLCLTTGNKDGIGLEVTAKALQSIGPQSGVQFFLWRSPESNVHDLDLIDSRFDRLTVNSWPEALSIDMPYGNGLVDICSDLSPPEWVEISAKSAMFGQIHGIVTAPMSKVTIQESGFKQIGHTEILAKVTKSKFLFMAFVGDQFNVLLATSHIPIKDVAKALTFEQLEAALTASNTLRSWLPSPNNRKPLAVLGLNPHAGENGIIGDEESVINSVINEFLKRNIPVVGPLVPDAAFFKQNWTKYAVFVCPYHDQGLIPFKMIHGQESGVHITMGLPFVRTSVDHGTAKDIFGLNKADSRSMALAIQWAIDLIHRRKTGATP